MQVYTINLVCLLLNTVLFVVTRQRFVVVVVVYTEEKDYGESVRLMRRLLAVFPDHLDGTVQLATALMELGDNTREAKSLFLSALRRDPHHLQALRHLGSCNMYFYIRCVFVGSFIILLVDLEN